MSRSAILPEGDARPASVRRYRWRRLWGRSGIVYSMSPRSSRSRMVTFNGPDTARCPRRDDSCDFDSVPSTRSRRTRPASGSGSGSRFERPLPVMRVKTAAGRKVATTEPVCSAYSGDGEPFSRHQSRMLRVPEPQRSMMPAREKTGATIGFVGRGLWSLKGPSWRARSGRPLAV